MTASGVVCRNADGGRVEIEFAAPLQCRGCEGICTWRRLPLVQRADFATTLPLQAGDHVDVSLPERYVLLGTLLVHGLPLAALLGGALAGVATTGTDAGCLAGAVTAIVLTAAATPRLRRRIEALTGSGVLEQLRRASETLALLAQSLRAKPDEILQAVEKLTESEKKLRKQLEAQQMKQAASQADQLIEGLRAGHADSTADSCTGPEPIVSVGTSTEGICCSRLRGSWPRNRARSRIRRTSQVRRPRAVACAPPRAPV